MFLLLRSKVKWLSILVVSPLLVLTNTQYVFGQNISKYELSIHNTEVAFSARHFGVLKVKGQFNKLEGLLTLKSGIPLSSQLTIYTESIDSGDGSRDRSIKGESFFDSKNNPIIQFSIENNVSRNELSGVLTIKGVSRKVDAPYTLKRIGKQLIIEAKCAISRSEFELEFSGMDDLVSDEVQITAKIVLDMN